MNRSCSYSLTHTSADMLSQDDIADEIKQIKINLSNEFLSDSEKLSLLLQTVDELATFELGRFLIKNKSLSGYWTWYVITGYKHHHITSALEKFFVENSPVVLATQHRFAIFQSLLKNYIQSNSVICSLPCGMMADLLTLQLPSNITNVKFVGIDLDSSVFRHAENLASQLNITNKCDFIAKDAWNLNIENQFDIITSNGLNIYEKDDNRVVALYNQMYRALKNNGYLICSALTPPPTMTQDCEWDMNQINRKDLANTALLMQTILKATWSNFRSSKKTSEQLREAGFENVEIFWDKQKMFPTFSAQKRLA